jgi:hypothetical protein
MLIMMVVLVGLLLVSTKMSSQVASQSELLVADVTVVWFVSCVIKGKWCV